MRALCPTFALTTVAALTALTGCQDATPMTAPVAINQAVAAAPGASSQPAAAAAAKDEHDHGAATGKATGPGSTPADREAVDADGTVRRGGALSKDAAIVPVSVALKQADLAGKTVKIQGKVESVCQKKGCWFVIVGDKPEDKIRITAKDYGFFVPKAAAGRTAVIEGQLEVKELDVKTAQHLEDERVMGGAEQPKKIEAPQKEFSIEASALEMRSL